MTTTIEAVADWKQNAIGAARAEQARLAIEEAQRQQEGMYKRARELQAWRAKFRTALLAIGVTGAEEAIDNAIPDHPTIEVDGIEFFLLDGLVKVKYGCHVCGKHVVVTAANKVQLGNILIDMDDYICRHCQEERAEAEEREQA